MDRLIPRERLELVKNAEYWDAKRVPKVDRLLLLPMPEANARTAALLSAQVKWIENPWRDALAQVRQRDFIVYQNDNRMFGRGSSAASRARPGTDVRVRRARSSRCWKCAR